MNHKQFVILAICSRGQNFTDTCKEHAVLSLNDFCRYHFSVMEWVQHKLTWHFLNTSDVCLVSLSRWSTQLHQDPVFLQMILGERSGVLGVKGPTFSPPNTLLLIVAKQLIFVSSDHRVFLQKVFSLSMGSAANFSRALSSVSGVRASFFSCKTCLTVDTDTCLPAAPNSLQNSFLAFFFFYIWAMHCTNSCLHKCSWHL